jgi:hypothetical protein
MLAGIVMQSARISPAVTASNRESVPVNDAFPASGAPVLPNATNVEEASEQQSTAMPSLAAGSDASLCL